MPFAEVEAMWGLFVALKFVVFKRLWDLVSVELPAGN